jgi:hypothetical protein
MVIVVIVQQMNRAIELSIEPCHVRINLRIKASNVSMEHVIKNDARAFPVGQANFVPKISMNVK